MGLRLLGKLPSYLKLNNVNKIHNRNFLLSCLNSNKCLSLNTSGSSSISNKRLLSCSPVTRHNARFILSSDADPTHIHASRLLKSTMKIDRLSVCDEILIIQKSFLKEEKEDKVHIEYKYEITDKSGESLFHATQMYATNPPRFDLKLYGPGDKLLVTHKLLQSLSSHLLNMQIICPGGLYLGSIEESIDADGQPLFAIKNNFDSLQAMVLTDFAHNGFSRTIKILSPDKTTTIGKISKKWGGFKFDNLVMSIKLPQNMDSSLRASLIGLSILLVILNKSLDCGNFRIQELFYTAPVPKVLCKLSFTITDSWAELGAD